MAIYNVLIKTNISEIISSLQALGGEVEWDYQLNMAIFNEMMKTNITEMISSPKSLGIAIQYLFSRLSFLWDSYLEVTFEYPEINAADRFPPKLENRNLFNFTNYIRRDWQTFLAVYAASFPSVGWQKSINTLFKNAAKKIFMESESFNENPRYYDKLIVDCAYQKPLRNSQPDMSEGCGDFKPILTSNGLCYSFNGIETEYLWYDSEIVQSFKSVFGKSQTETKKFRGTGLSEGKQ